MSSYRFDENCKGCRPAMLELHTGRALPDNSPEMITVNRLWDRQSAAVKEAWHRVTCLNSQDPVDRELALKFANLIGTALAHRVHVHG